MSFSTWPITLRLAGLGPRGMRPRCSSSSSTITLTSQYGGFSETGTTTTTSGVSIPWPKIYGGPGSNNFMLLSTWNEDKWVCFVPGAYESKWDVSLNGINTADGTPGAEGFAAGDCSLEQPWEPIV